MTKRVWLESCSKSVTARDLALMILRTVFRDQGIPLGILTDMDSRFISEFWQEFFLLLQTNVKITSAYDQQSNGGYIRFRHGTRKLCHRFVGPFSVRILGPNTVEIKTEGRFRAVSQVQNIRYLCPYAGREVEVVAFPSLAAADSFGTLCRRYRGGMRGL